MNRQLKPTESVENDGVDDARSGIGMPYGDRFRGNHQSGSSTCTIDVDLAKHDFQVHGVDGQGKIVLVRQLRRQRMMEFFRKLPSWHGGVRDAPSLGPRVDESWA
jgi:hypothetical protein